MSFIVQVRRAAEFDVTEAQTWYEDQRHGLGTEFHSKTSQIFARLAQTPLMYPAVYIERFEGQLFIASLTSSGFELRVK